MSRLFDRQLLRFSRFRLTMEPSNLVGFLTVQAGGASGAAAGLGADFVVDEGG
ncbi:hypothetical protein [Streptomyces sp. NBC_00557]|uniref:hypothetical protein n=1 Tax=Streptomyces sp. NBC_00557 TaxID=2975776 RepID=UPI002E80675F|nr:hypothetical protein [Streptomyces sp. NBC_00557]WUC39699.1 hypothetical protein OG956_38730 [Streptomyces sp. NBC_00557]